MKLDYIKEELEQKGFLARNTTNAHNRIPENTPPLFAC